MALVSARRTVLPLESKREVVSECQWGVALEGLLANAMAA